MHKHMNHYFRSSMCTFFVHCVLICLIRQVWSGHMQNTRQTPKISFQLISIIYRSFEYYSQPNSHPAVRVVYTAIYRWRGRRLQTAAVWTLNQCTFRKHAHSSHCKKKRKNAHSGHFKQTEHSSNALWSKKRPANPRAKILISQKLLNPTYSF